MATPDGRVTRRKFLTLTAAAGALLAACGGGQAAPSASARAGGPSSAAGSASGASTSSPVKVRVAYGSTTLLNLPIWASFEKGFYKKHGIDVELSQIRGSTITQALIGGSVDIIGSTASSTSLANMEGGDTLLIGSNLNSIHNDIVVNPKRITKPEELKGKTAAITKAGDFSEVAIFIALRGLGMARNDVKYVTGFPGDADKLAALVNGYADFTSLDFGMRDQYASAGMKRLFSLLDVKAHFIMSGIYTSRAYARGHGAVLENYIKAMTEALYFFHHDKEGTLAVASKYMKEEPSVIEPGYELFKPHMNQVPEFTLDDVKESLDVLDTANPKAKTANPADFYTTMYLDNVRKSGFFKQVWGSELAE